MSIPRRLFSKLDEVFRGDKDFSRSPLRHLLKSNATPSDSEVIAIHALITEAEASIEELRRRFSTLDHASRVIESKLLETIEAHRALLSPVRYLPSEVLQEIFLRYADTRVPSGTIRTIPWRLGHISRRWRKIALSLPSLWDDIPRIYLSKAGLERSYFRALICLLQRSGTSPTLKLIISHHYSPFGLRRGYKSATSIMKEIMLHSKRIEKLLIHVDDAIIPLLQGFKGCLPNLRFLRVLCDVLDAPSIDIFETAPALRQVAVEGNCDRVLLPWSQITHFKEEGNERVARFVLLSSISLHSLTNLDIHKNNLDDDDESTFLSPYRPTTLPNLRTLKVVIDDYDYKDVEFFLESLTIPVVEVIKIRYMGPLIPRLVSMFSGSRGPSRLQKLAFCTIPLQTGELSALLKLTPHLVELDIDMPPAGDLLRLTYSEGEVMLVPMLQDLYIRIPVLTTVAQIEHFDTLAQVRCELGIHKDSEDPTMLSLRPGTWTTLYTLRVILDSPESRDSSQRVLNNWSSSFTQEEYEAIGMLKRCNPRSGSYVKDILSCIESYEITNKVLRVGVFIWMHACGIFTLIFFQFFIFFRRQIYTLNYEIISLGSC